MAIHRLFEAVHEMKAPLMMVVVQVVHAGVNILYKLAASNGMNLMLVVAYRLIFATAVLAPLAFFLERKSWPKITWTVLVQAFFCGLFGGSMGQNLYLASLSMTSATYASAMANLIPAITFVLAVSLGYVGEGEAEDSCREGKSGGNINGDWCRNAAHVLQGHGSQPLVNAREPAAPRGGDPAGPGGLEQSPLGSLLAVASCFCYALWLIIQAKMSEGFPYQYTSTALMTFMGSIQAVVYALCRERDWSRWKLGWNIRLLTVSYSGIVGAGLCFTLMAWCVRMRGPVFVSVFNPLMLVTVALAGSMVLDEKLHLGSILGSGLIVLGLYAVLWGKRKENKKTNQLVPSSSPSESESIEIVVASSNRTDVKEGDDVRESAQKESEAKKESFQEKRGGGGEQA
ncbi:hypothetical protein NL676_039437 [Syzygium grande]|nr:hypothetical protein NL676_039437 [Syzygium grande]